MSWTLTKPGIDIKTERRGIELMVFFPIPGQGRLSALKLKRMQTCYRLTSQSGENLPFFANFTKTIFKALTHL